MLKLIIGTIVFIAVFLGGLNFVFSDKFQKYGDTNKAQWTCYVNNFAGNLYIVMSKYDEAYDLFDKSVKRCPDKPLVEEARFQMAKCLEFMGRPSEAVVAYEQYANDYKDINPKRARLATRSIQAINLTR